MSTVKNRLHLDLAIATRADATATRTAAIEFDLH